MYKDPKGGYRCKEFNKCWVTKAPVGKKPPGLEIYYPARYHPLEREISEDEEENSNTPEVPEYQTSEPEEQKNKRISHIEPEIQATEIPEEKETDLKKLDQEFTDTRYKIIHSLKREAIISKKMEILLWQFPVRVLEEVLMQGPPQGFTKEIRLRNLIKKVDREVGKTPEVTVGLWQDWKEFQNEYEKNEREEKFKTKQGIRSKLPKEGWKTWELNEPLSQMLAGKGRMDDIVEITQQIKILGPIVTGMWRAEDINPGKVQKCVLKCETTLEPLIRLLVRNGIYPQSLKDWVLHELADTPDA